MVFHNFCQVVQFIDFNLNVKPETDLILVLRLECNKLAIRLLTLFSLNLFLIRDFAE